jgi:hypothetical protein
MPLTLLVIQKKIKPLQVTLAATIKIKKKKRSLFYRINLTFFHTIGKTTNMKATISDSFTTTKQIHVMSVNQRLKLTKNIRYTRARKPFHFLPFKLYGGGLENTREEEGR